MQWVCLKYTVFVVIKVILGQFDSSLTMTDVRETPKQVKSSKTIRLKFGITWRI